jgi:hypothetical protein
MPKLCDMTGVRGGDEGFPVQLWRDDETGRLTIRAINEGGFACVDIDLSDLTNWLGLAFDSHAFVAALPASKYPR